MFVSSDVWMVFKSAKLTTEEIEGVSHRMAECQFVLDPFPADLAREMGESIWVHGYDEDGAIRPELASITLDPRVPKQRLYARGAEGVPATEITLVEVLTLQLAKQSDEKTGKVWLKATVRVRFDFAPKVHREWIAMYFGMGFYASFEMEQGELLTAARQAAKRLQNQSNRDGTTMTISVDGETILKIAPNSHGGQEAGVER